MLHYPMQLKFPTHDVQAVIAWCPGWFVEANIGMFFEYQGCVFTYEGDNKAKFRSSKINTVL